MRIYVFLAISNSMSDDMFVEIASGAHLDVLVFRAGNICSDEEKPQHNRCKA